MSFREEPCFFDDHCKEIAKLLLNGMDEMLEFKLCCPDAFGLNTDGLGGIGSDDGVVGNEWGFEVVKGIAYVVR